MLYLNRWFKSFIVLLQINCEEGILYALWHSLSTLLSDLSTNKNIKKKLFREKITTNYLSWEIVLPIEKMVLIYNFMYHPVWRIIRSNHDELYQLVIETCIDSIKSIYWSEQNKTLYFKLFKVHCVQVQRQARIQTFT